jgi:CheY-like chemotaxis protein
MQVRPKHARVDATNCILIAEDHFDSREALTALFEAFGYRVIQATNGREAVSRAAAGHPDVILMDIMMPELDGFDASRAIRALPNHRFTPIIAITALEDARELAFQAGMNDYVRKPVDIRGLLAKVSGWLSPAAV